MGKQTAHVGHPPGLDANFAQVIEDPFPGSSIFIEYVNLQHDIYPVFVPLKPAISKCAKGLPISTKAIQSGL
jgi:hypothetical protein